MGDTGTWRGVREGTRHRDGKGGQGQSTRARTPGGTGVPCCGVTQGLLQGAAPTGHSHGPSGPRSGTGRSVLADAEQGVHLTADEAEAAGRV